MIPPLHMFLILRRRIAARRLAAVRRRALARRLTSVLEIVMSFAVLNAIASEQRTTRAFPRSFAWAHFMLSTFACPSDFRSVFRMNRPQFVLLYDTVKVSLSRQSTQLREPIPGPVWLAIFLSFSGSGVAFSILAAQFGVGLSTVSSIIHDVAQVIRDQLQSRIQFPHRPNELLAAAMRFEESHGTPGCVGAIDGCHIPIRQPAIKKSSKFYNRKGFYSVVLSAVVDVERRFIDIDVRWPGSVGDSRVFYNSPIGVLASRGWDLDIESHTCKIQTGWDQFVTVPFFLLADSAYANSQSVVTTFEIAEVEADPVVANLNKKLAGMRYVVECAFGILKSRWRVLGKAIEFARTNHKSVPALVAALCIVHNFLVDNGDSSWDAASEAKQSAFYSANYLVINNCGATKDTNGGSSKTRENLLRWFRYRDSIRQVK